LIFNLQIVRAFAAIGVVIYHIEFHFRPDLHTDFLGVATFFVLSGFIMCFITRDGSDDFLINRLIRIVPLYWLMTAFRTIILNGTAIFHAQFWIDQSDMIVKSLFFLLSDQPPLVGPASGLCSYRSRHAFRYSDARLIRRTLLFAPLYNVLP
jgi:peptidoglycan/LPS O-acetylase OafA/YrhL